MFKIGMELLFPRRCPICGKVLGIDEGLVHAACQAKLSYISGPVCLRCGKPVITAEDEYCADCTQRRHQFEQGKAVWVYDRWMQKSMAAYKYHGRREYADFYIRQVIAVHGVWLASLNVDAVMPVPVNWKKKRKRGYNQAELIARGVADYLETMKKTTASGRKRWSDKFLWNCLSVRRTHLLDCYYLKRTLWTEPQKDLSPIQRYANLKKAFTIRGEVGKYHSVLLVDDIYTTGSTIDACAETLKKAGVKEVYFVSLCIGSDRD